MARAALPELPVDRLAPLVTTAKEKGLELLDSDAAHEIRRRGHDVYAAARGEKVRKVRRWPLAMGFLALGAAAGAAASFLSRRMETPVPWQPTGPAADISKPPTTAPPTTQPPATKSTTKKSIDLNGKSADDVEIGATPTV